MGFRDNARLVRLALRLAATTDETAQRAVAADIDEVSERLLANASRKHDRRAYASVSLTRARVALGTDDVARVLPEAGTALLLSAENPQTADSMSRRYEAAGLLAHAFSALADPLNAATAAIEGLLHGRPSDDDDDDGLLDDATLCRYLLGARGLGDSPYIGSLLTIADETLPQLELDPTTIAPLQEIAHQRLGQKDLDYWSAYDAWLQIQQNDVDLACRIELEVGLLLADAALDQGLHNVALSLAEALIGGRVWAPWLESPLFEVAAKCHLQGGRLDQALVAAIDGYQSCLLGSLGTASTIGRGNISALGKPNYHLALRVADLLGDNDTQFDLLANETVQATLGAHQRVAVPDWALDRVEATLKYGTHTVLALVSGDWDTSLEDQVVYGSSTGSRFQRQLRSKLSLNHRSPRLSCAIRKLQQIRTTEDLAWFATLAEGTAHWATVDFANDQLDCGAIDLANSQAGKALFAFQMLHTNDSQVTTAPEEPAFRDPIRWLANPGSDEERSLMAAAGDLLPPAFNRSTPDDQPISVLASLAPGLTQIPWAAVRLGADKGRRLAEVAEIELIGAVSQLQTKRPPNLDGYEISISCCNPDGTLRPATPVAGQTTLDGSRTPVDAGTFLDHLGAARHRAPGGVLFVRGHLGSEGSARHAPDRGLLFANNEVVSGRLLASIARSHPDLLTLPDRVVLAACMSSIADASEGSGLGFCSAVRHLGTQEVIASLFPVPDTRWSCDFDHRLASIATQPVSLSAGLRSAQLEAIADWGNGDVAQFGEEYEDGPHPLVWAAYVSVR